MTIGPLRVLALAAFAATPAASRAADALPILPGRWSAGDCARLGPESARWFGPGMTGSFNERCSVTAERDAGGLYRTHLACRYRAAHDDAENVVVQVLSPRSLRWVDQCTAVVYRFCGAGEPPALPPR